MLFSQRGTLSQYLFFDSTLFKKTILLNGLYLYFFSRPKQGWGLFLNFCFFFQQWKTWQHWFIIFHFLFSEILCVETKTNFSILRFITVKTYFTLLLNCSFPSCGIPQKKLFQLNTYVLFFFLQNALSNSFMECFFFKLVLIVCSLLSVPGYARFL